MWETSFRNFYTPNEKQCFDDPSIPVGPQTSCHIQDTVLIFLARSSQRACHQSCEKGITFSSAFNCLDDLSNFVHSIASIAIF